MGGRAMIIDQTGTAFLEARRGLLLAARASVLALMIHDWFFGAPVHRLTVDNPSGHVVLVTVLVRSVLIGQRLARVQNWALDGRRQEAGLRRLYDVGQAAPPSWEVAIDLPELLPETRLDRDLIRPGATNLLDKAVRYSPTDGPNSMPAEVVQDQRRVAVLNEGGSIPPSDFDRLFAKSYHLSAEPGGTVPGPAIARGVVDAYHGRIWAEKAGSGDVAFRFTLPTLRHADGPAAVASLNGSHP